MITLSNIRLTVQNYIPYDKGFMFTNVNRFSEDSTKFSVTYDGNAVPYAMYQEYGFTHWKSGKFIDINQFFIRNDTVNALDYVINSASAGEKSLIMAQSKRTVQARASQIAQGTLQSLKGNKNR